MATSNMHGEDLHCYICDNCKSIADTNSIATDRFITENSIDYNCTTMTPGESYQHSKYEPVQIISFHKKLTSEILNAYALPTT